MWCSLFCFYKQKTAYEMRISDWSSDVCSSDLRHHLIIAHDVINVGSDRAQLARMDKEEKAILEAESLEVVADRGYFDSRSEEHTSELQSLMRNSYAAYCLKKNIRTTDTNTILIIKTTTDEHKPY